MKKLTLAAAVAVGLAAVVPAVAQAPAMNMAIGKLGRGPMGTVTIVLYGELVRVSGNLTGAQPGQTID
jgi:F0F1-type ATP synthase membrane subunit c/vacuolar-type H+-ATPase subunit K